MITPISEGGSHYCTQCWSNPKKKVLIRLEYLRRYDDGDVYRCSDCQLEQYCTHAEHQWP